MTRLAILGIDGATYRIIRPMIADGELPHIARMLREGASANLESTIPPITPPAWVSMMTGVNPGRHGIYHFLRRSIGSYRLGLVDSGNFAGMDAFSLLSRRGWTTGGFAVPMTYPPFPVNGYMISGIPMPLQGEGGAWPAGTWQQMEEFLGKDYEPDINYAQYDGKNEPGSEDLDRYEQLRDDLFRVERERIGLKLEWIRRHPTDFYFCVLSITDRCQHYFWKFQDRTHDGWSREGEDRFGEVIKDAYRLADEAVGRFREALGEECVVALVSDHGFGTFAADFFVNRWLEDEGYLKFKRIPRWTLGVTTLADTLRRARLGVVGKLLPGPIGRLPVGRPKYKRRRDPRDIDWKNTRVFAAMYGLCLNLKGREPEGIVDPADREALQEEVIERLRALRDPLDPDKPAVDDAIVAADCYTGDYLETAPDIQFMVQGLACLPKEDLDAPAQFGRRKYAAVSGTHRMDGIFAVAGGADCPLQAGAVYEGMHIQDSLPTLLHLVGEAIPRWMEGKVQADALDAEWLSANSPRFSDEEARLGTPTADIWSDEESRRVEESLKGLGYL
jgi:predicted AlkP superfamily phosphohydrolase/phosphomutase